MFFMGLWKTEVVGKVVEVVGKVVEVVGSCRIGGGRGSALATLLSHRKKGKEVMHAEIVPIGTYKGQPTQRVTLHEIIGMNTSLRYTTNGTPVCHHEPRVAITSALLGFHAPPSPIFHLFRPYVVDRGLSSLFRYAWWSRCGTHYLLLSQDATDIEAGIYHVDV